MKFAVLSNVKGEIVLAHEETIDLPIEWIEYIPAEDNFLLIYEDGTSETLDLDFTVTMKKNLTNGTQVIVSHMTKEKIVSNKIVSILIQEY